MTFKKWMLSSEGQLDCRWSYSNKCDKDFKDFINYIEQTPNFPDSHEYWELLNYLHHHGKKFKKVFERSFDQYYKSGWVIYHNLNCNKERKLNK